MDFASLAAPILLGTIAGFLAGLVPGLHQNTLASAALLVAAADPMLAYALTAAAFAHGISSLIPSTYLGLPDPDSALGLLPAHRLLVAGHGREALLLAANATVLGVLAAIALLYPYKWLMEQPGRLRTSVEPFLGWVLLALAVALVLSERRRNRRSVLWAAAAFLLAGLLALTAQRLPMQGYVGLTDAQLAPVLSGLFGCASLVEGLRTGRPLPPQGPPPRPGSRPEREGRKPLATGLVRGVLASIWTSAVPGLTAGVAASVAGLRAPRWLRRDRATHDKSVSNIDAKAARGRDSADEDPRRALAMLSAVAAAHGTFTLVLLWLAGQARSGVAIGVRKGLAPAIWSAGALPLAMTVTLVAAIAATALAYGLLRGIEAHIPRVVRRVPPRILSGAALAILVLLVAALTGVWGLAVCAAATLVGLLPHATGIRRIHLSGALLLPAILSRF